MSHNLQAATEQDFALPDHRVLALRGRDSVAFAQAQCMNDVSLLGDGQWQWNGWLTPKGRVVALFALFRRDAETLWLLLPDAEPATLASQLKRYVFRSNVAFHVRDDLSVVGAFAAPVQACGAASAEVEAGVELDLSGEGGPRRLRIGEVRAANDELQQSRWRTFDIQHGFPRLTGEQVEQWTPQQLSLDRLKAYSVKKGCYPGQEIVARTHFLGQAKRGLMRLQGDGVGDSGDVMAGDAQGPATASARPIGRLVCAEHTEGLAVLPLDAGEGPFATAGQPCRRLPLQDGLAR